jgi:hypothetical protein
MPIHLDFQNEIHPTTATAMAINIPVGEEMSRGFSNGGQIRLGPDT